MGIVIAGGDEGFGAGTLALVKMGFGGEGTVLEGTVASAKMPEFSRKRVSTGRSKVGDFERGGEGVSSKEGAGKLQAVGEFW